MRLAPGQVTHRFGRVDILAFFELILARYQLSKRLTDRDGLDHVMVVRVAKIDLFPPVDVTDFSVAGIRKTIFMPSRVLSWAQPSNE
jgi:hypothetical protein